MQDGSFQVNIKHNYELWVFKRPFLLSVVGVLFLIYGSLRNIWLEYLGLMIAETQEEQKMGRISFAKLP